MELVMELHQGIERCVMPGVFENVLPGHGHTGT